MIGRLVHSADFQRLLATPAWSRSAHFAVHHLPAAPSSPKKATSEAGQENLSTGGVNKLDELVDELSGRYWLGTVLPKRLARRAVTRNLLRRQVRAAMLRHAGHLPGGLWVVRLRSGFARTDFVSAASSALRASARSELDLVLGRRQGHRPAQPRP